ncbi:esterase/lipase family protein [Streptomyces griseoviridis]|uniref:Pimeloyl-ACP methyl ester carboxylesterase n=1 Tax=Streptomyces griseoviridis TaxID=45398 RepID=A0ABT9LIT8_STRGD|nr:alpha/beta fold hydrolase [Streptomyces griseoviridis]MDP9683626.1 pimeloyl-ACP methyl ester carboxylesterase [Streptomyces griseoviridis]GGS93543.1 lipase [Streptomyces griseoviridis]
MKVNWATQPFRPLCQWLAPVLPVKVAGVSLGLLKATALDIAILAGHVLLYPSGIGQERRAAPLPAPLPAPDPAGPRLTPEEPAPRLPAQAGRRPPVVLLHGFIDNRSVFVLLRRSLAQHGRQHVESLNYSPLTCDIRTAAELLGRHLEEICARTGKERVDIVGHSLGGLIARYYVQCLGGDRRVRMLVTLGTPHTGTRVAPLANAHPIVRQMRPGSPVIEELSRPASGCRTRFVSFWSDFDPLMVPLEAARLDHPDLLTQNVRVSGIGHLALPVHPAVATGIRQALDASHIDARSGADPNDPAGSAGPSGLTVA